MVAKRLAVALALLVVAACGGGSARLEKLGTSDVVLAFGDSLTHGTGANPAESYPAVLEGRIGRKVVNAGVPGETSAEGLARLPGVLEEVRPKLLILCHGGNDFLRRLDETRARDNIRAMIALARGKGVDVVLLATPEPGVPRAVPAVCGELAGGRRVRFEEAVIRAVLVDNRLKSDLVHPNARGYAEIAGAVKKLLEKSGAL
jgi:lysophospholipase L1-like esterase